MPNVEENFTSRFSSYRKSEIAPSPSAAWFEAPETVDLNPDPCILSDATKQAQFFRLMVDLCANKGNFLAVKNYVDDFLIVPSALCGEC